MAVNEWKGMHKFKGFKSTCSIFVPQRAYFRPKTLAHIRMKKELKISEFSASSFRDIDKSKLDFEANAVHIIEKAINKGTWEDFKLVLDYYGREMVAKTVKNLRYMDERTLYFSDNYF